MLFQNKRPRVDIKKTHLAIVAIIVVGAILRFVNLSSTPGWWPDEGVMLNIATNLANGKMQMFSFSYPMNPHPPLFFLAAIPFIKILGSSILSLRILSALLGVISIFLAFLIGRQIKNTSAGLLSAIIVAITPAIVLTSRVSLSYELLSTLYLLTIFIILLWKKNQSNGTLVLASVVAGLCFTTSYGGISAILFLILFVAVSNWKRLPLSVVFSILPPIIYVTLMLAIDQNAFLHDLRFLFARPESQTVLKQILQSFGRLAADHPILTLGFLGFFFAKQRVHLCILFFAILIALVEFKTRGYWWYMMTFLPIAAIGLSVIVVQIFARFRIKRLAAVLIVAAIAIVPLYGTTKAVFIKKSFALEEEKVFSPENLGELKGVVKFINDNTDREDMVISSAHISWMIQARPSDPILSYVSHNKATTNFPNDMRKTGRFVYNPDYRLAKYYLEDKFMRNWFPGQPGIEEYVIKPIKENWELVFDLEEFKLYVNPELK